jgi:hypothetical protein
VKKRKGARWLDIGLERWSYYVGQRFVEIRSPENVKTLVPRAKLDEVVLHTYDCECGPGCDYQVEERTSAAFVTLPGKVAQFIRKNLRKD